jgi:predicted molibdopterin-dependent oxidoreductase YjgC
MRIKEHPIFGEISTGAPVTIYLDNRPIQAYEGDTIAAALWAAGERVSRYTPKRCDARGLFCAIGYCSDCLMVVDGVPNTRTCVTPVRDGMRVEIQQGNGDWSRYYEQKHI